MNNLDSSTEKARVFYKSKEFKDILDVGSEPCFYPHWTYLGANEKDHEKSKMKVDSWTAQSFKHLKHLSNPSENFDVEKGNLKRPLDSLVQPMNVPKKPTVFAHFQNESNDGNMPVILNVFTLSQEPTNYIKQQPINKNRESFFVTPPCSPPSPATLVQQTGNRNTDSCGEIQTAFTSVCSTRPFLNEFITQRKMYDVYSPERLDRGILPVLPDATNQFVDQENYTVEDQNVNCADKIQFSQAKKGNTKISVAKERFSLQIPYCCGTQDNNGSKNYPVNDSPVSLSPRDIKVLELKKRLKEQEEALKRLRAEY